MTTRDDILREANWTRMRTAITDAAKEYRRFADDLERLSFDNSRGRRSPESIISEAALASQNGSGIAARMLHRMAGWAEAINEIDRYAAKVSQVCGYQIDDPHTTCVLAPGHDLPTEDGLTVHVSADGVKFA